MTMNVRVRITRLGKAHRRRECATPCSACGVRKDRHAVIRRVDPFNSTIMATLPYPGQYHEWAARGSVIHFP